MATDSRPLTARLREDEPPPPDADGIPAGTLKDMQGYVKRGENPGGFLRAVFANNLASATRYADKENMVALYAIANWAYYNTPKRAFGSFEKVDAWIRKGDDWRAKEAERQEEAITDVETKAP